MWIVEKKNICWSFIERRSRIRRHPVYLTLSTRSNKAGLYQMLVSICTLLSSFIWFFFSIGRAKNFHIYGTGTAQTLRLGGFLRYVCLWNPAFILFFIFRTGRGYREVRERERNTRRHVESRSHRASFAPYMAVGCGFFLSRFSCITVAEENGRHIERASMERVALWLSKLLLFVVFFSPLYIWSSSSSLSLNSCYFRLIDQRLQLIV